jgi:hypothetical protein
MLVEVYIGEDLLRGCFSAVSLQDVTVVFMLEAPQRSTAIGRPRVLKNGQGRDALKLVW